MDVQDILIILLIVVAVITAIITLIYFLKKRKKKKPIEEDDLLSLFNKDNITDITFKRNKIIVKFNDVREFDAKALHTHGAKGISIVGDKVKFYFEESNKKTKDIYEKIKQTLEG